LILANSPLAGWFAAIWKTRIELTLGDFRLAGDLGHLVINDGLMAIFFFVIGLEIKREIVAGELQVRRSRSTSSAARLPRSAYSLSRGVSRPPPLGGFRSVMSNILGLGLGLGQDGRLAEESGMRLGG